MKWLLTFFVCFVSVWGVAQGDTTGKPTCITPATCSNNLTMPIAAFAGNTVIGTVHYYAKGCNNINSSPPTTMPPNFHKVTYDTADDGFYGCISDIKDCSSDGSVLAYKAIYPNKSTINNFNVCKLPVVIFFHGGSFADCNGSFDAAEIQAIGTNFAERGFIFISVEYRKGIKALPGDVYYTVQQILGIWRACQDARGAIRSIIKHETTTTVGEKETEFHIDVNNIFIAGNSAGSLIAMNVAYYTHQMVIDAFPPGIDDNNVLGDIDQDYYYGGDGSGANGINFTIKGVLDLWGGVLLPSPYTVSNPSAFFFKNGHTLPPTIAFCGALDPTFPPVSKALKFPNTTTTPSVLTENYCLNDQSGSTYYTVQPYTNLTVNYGNILGSQSIYGMLHNSTNKVFSEFYLDCQMMHGLDKCITCLGSYPRKKVNNMCKACPFNSDFGTTNNTVAGVNYYIVQRAATFFQAVMNNAQWNTLHTTKFVECENKRYSCSTVDNNNACYSDQFPEQQVCPQ